MPGRRVLSDAQLIEMAELRERGWSIKQIAAHFTSAGTSVGENAIKWQCMRVGADLPPAQRLRSGRATVPVTRFGQTIRPFLPEEDRELLRLEADGLSMSAIAHAMGRRQSSVRARLMCLARQDARADEVLGV